MANTNVSREEVKSIVNGLECSPSKTDAKGNYGGKPSISPTAKNGGVSATGGTHLATHTSEFQMSDRGKKLPNYQTKFAKKAEQV